MSEDQPSAGNRPLIGLTCGQEISFDIVSVAEGRVQDGGHQNRLGAGYSGAIEEAGGLPVILPIPYQVRSGPRTAASHAADLAAAALLESVDGLVLTGGPDLDPELFDEDPHPVLGKVDLARDCFELALARLALTRGIPTLGICRGEQVLAVAAGGDLYQDLGRQKPDCLKHRQDAARDAATHYVEIRDDTLLSELIGRPRLKVNSFHHQAVRRLPAGWLVSAIAPDGVIEAIEPKRSEGESGADGWVLGLQWHPENMWVVEPLFLRLFRGLIDAARRRRAGR